MISFHNSLFILFWIASKTRAGMIFSFLLFAPWGLLMGLHYMTYVQSFLFRHLSHHGTHRCHRSIKILDKVPTSWSISPASPISNQIGSIVENLIAEMVSPFIRLFNIKYINVTSFNYLV